ncbi:MAG: hypothetical protein J6Y31_01785, partial [Bacteroidales bacterium]|nr:hypothetical protein [Bacteroidales bacterium]
MRNILTAIFLLAAVLPAGADGWKSPRQLRRENARLKLEVQSLRQQVDSFRFQQEALIEKLSGENENKTAQAMEQMTEAETPPASTDTLLGRWYLNRQPPREEPLVNMDSVRFSTDVPDSVLMDRLQRMNAFISLPYNETVKGYMVMYSEKMPRRMAQMMALSQYYFPIFEETFRKYDLPMELKYMAIIESNL